MSVRSRRVEGMARRLTQWTKAGRWENSVIAKASPNEAGWRVVLFVPGERTSINYQLNKRAWLDNCADEEGQDERDNDRSHGEGHHNNQPDLHRYKTLQQSPM